MFDIYVRANDCSEFHTKVISRDFLEDIVSCAMDCADLHKIEIVDGMTGEILAIYEKYGKSNQEFWEFFREN